MITYKQYKEIQLQKLYLNSITEQKTSLKYSNLISIKYTFVLYRMIFNFSVHVFKSVLVCKFILFLFIFLLNIHQCTFEDIFSRNLWRERRSFGTDFPFPLSSLASLNSFRPRNKHWSSTTYHVRGEQNDIGCTFVITFIGKNCRFHNSVSERNI